MPEVKQQPDGALPYPLSLLADPDKTTLTTTGGLVLGFGPGPGLGNAIFWNRVGSLFSCYRPSVARMTLFDATPALTAHGLDKQHAALRWPAPLVREASSWEPGVVRAGYSCDDVQIRELRYATATGLVCQLIFELADPSAQPREFVAFFQGSVEQWPFFDFTSTRPGTGGRVPVDPPTVECTADAVLGSLTVVQHHPHEGLPPLSSIQRLSCDHQFAAWGFGLNESDLRCLWQDHGCLAGLRLRLGQVGGRHTDPGQPSRFTHRHPLYYFACRLSVGHEPQVLTLACDFHTDDTGGDRRPANTRKSAEHPSPQQLGKVVAAERNAWQAHLATAVPQLECSDLELERYWYYVWYTLRANRTAPGSHITAPFTAPSKYLYWGPWIWDGYFHVLGEMWLKDADVARDSIRAVLQMQFPNGFIPVCSGSQYRMCFHDAVEGYTPEGGGGYASYVLPELHDYSEDEHQFEANFNYQTSNENPQAMARDFHNEKTQTPLITVAAAEYCALRGDAAFAREVLPALWDYEQWLWRRRTDRQGRFILWHGDESGWDNATRHYPVPCRPVDVQVHCLLHRVALRQLAELAGAVDIVTELAVRIDMTRTALRSYWNDDAEFYLDFAEADGERHRPQVSPAGLMPLLVGDTARLDEVLDATATPERFFTEFPLPTLAASDSSYAPHSWGWNGPVWLQVNFFTILGLLRCGSHKAAFDLWEKTRQLIIRDGRPHSYELYDPELGTGMGCPDYSWQAMINYLIIHGFAGVGLAEPCLIPALPPGLNSLRLSNLPGRVRSVGYVRDGGVLTISATLEKAAQLRLTLDSLGAVTSVESADNTWALVDGAWSPGAAAREWTIIVRCS